MYKKYLKRIFDLGLALIIVVITMPILLIAIIAIIFSNKSVKKIFFTQVRPGKNCKLFTLYKLKTLSEIYNLNGELLSDKERITRVGRFLRTTSIDEIPQLFNVIKGDMSLVGPRPLLIEYLSMYTPTQIRRQEVLPGITGWAQINGRNSMKFNKRFEYDVWYVDHISFMLDFKILIITFFKVFRSDGVLEQDPNKITDV